MRQNVESSSSNVQTSSEEVECKGPVLESEERHILLIPDSGNKIALGLHV